MFKRLFAALAVGGVVAVASVAAAAGLDVDNGVGPVLQAGSVTELTCDDAVQVYSTMQNPTAELPVLNLVNVGGIDGDCVGLNLLVWVTDGGGTELGFAAAPITGGDVSISFLSQAIPVADVEAIHLGIQNP